MDEIQAAKLRAPFKESQIEKKVMGARSYNYINHAVVTDRLIEVDPTWYWAPMALAENGMPQLDEHNGIWIKLTICGVTRIGYGASEPHQKGADAVKTAISDAIKNAAMRFGVALDLWGADSNGQSAESVTLSTPTLRSVPPLKAVVTESQELADFIAAQRPNDPAPIVQPAEQTGEPHCKHGSFACRIYRNGTSNNGKPYEGLFCQRKPYEEQCTPVSIDGKPWKK